MQCLVRIIMVSTPRLSDMSPQCPQAEDLKHHCRCFRPALATGGRVLTQSYFETEIRQVDQV